MDDDYYKKLEAEQQRRLIVSVKARNRGIIAKEWLKNNKLTRETMPEFQRLMKQADIKFEQQTNKQ